MPSLAGQADFTLRQDYRDNRHQRQEAQGNSAVADELRRAGRAVRDKLRTSSARRFRWAVPEVLC
uniref:Uncharacterized protein n=1 Tax=Siphoviridae sp. ctd9R8 TaxID=2825576 RepID=A0A8S5PU40_9CAUD|nr:MAG TPA: hypothetical protein [Siphoviridae sp. ctd9R8]